MNILKDITIEELKASGYDNLVTKVEMETDDKVFMGIKKDKRELLIKNLMELKQLSSVYGINITHIEIINDYKDDFIPLTKDTVLGIYIS